jgi:putative Mg2+ transporter-C (MgtC) family protein
MEFVPEELLKLMLAILIGGLIGYEREFRDKAAGFRTIIFITLGSTLYTILSMGIGNETNPTRIAANIVTGIGFLGAGAIMRDGARIAGLTTAATIWLAASLGMGIGGGRYLLVGIATVMIMIILWFFPAFERWIDNIRETRTYEISLPLESNFAEKLPKIFAECKLIMFNQAEHKKGQHIQLRLQSVGRPEHHKKLVQRLIKEKEVTELIY